MKNCYLVLSVNEIEAMLASGGASVILTFTREVIIVGGAAIIGTVTVAVDFELDPYDGLFSLDLYCTDFETETPQGLTWEAVEAPCEEWLTRNKARVEKRALKKEAPRSGSGKVF